MSRKRDALELFDAPDARDGQNTQLVLDKRLVKACDEGDIDTVIDLLQKGASVEAKAYTELEALCGANYTTPLIGAAHASKHQQKIASILLENGADVNVGDRNKVTPLHVACMNGHRDCVRLFIDSGADVNAVTLDHNRPGDYQKGFEEQSTPLHLAARHSHVACVEELLTHGRADYNIRDALGCTCLNLAAKSASEECVMMILQLTEGSQIFLTRMAGSGDYPLHDCVRRSFVHCVRELLLRGADANQQNAIGLSPLHYAALPSKNFSPEMMETLMTYAYELDMNQPVGSCNVRLGHRMSGLNPLQLLASHPDMVSQWHISRPTEFYFKSTEDPRQPMPRLQCAIHMIRYGADVSITRNGQTLLQQEVFRKDATDDFLLETILRAVCLLPVPDRPSDMRPEEVSDRSKEKLELVKKVFSSPRSLKQCCRVAIRKILSVKKLGIKKLKRVAELPLPSSLQDYLLLRS